MDGTVFPLVKLGKFLFRMENIVTKDSSAQVVTLLPALQESTATVKVLKSMDLTVTLVTSAQDRLKTEDHLT